MSLLWRLLTRRAGNEELPDDIGPDPAPESDDDEAEVGQEEAGAALHLRDEDFARVARELEIDENIKKHGGWPQAFHAKTLG